MLVLTRKKGQKLIINDNIEVTILETRGDNVKIGISAPRNVSIFREEIYEEIKKANEQSIKEISLPEFNNTINIPDSQKDFASEYLNKLKSISTKINKPDK
ncbi:MAG TPA: carbon storage regulator [Cyanobacteria bacterium UBA9971]|nr:carbon storage regulator [Cyanobacteria bacterium UBA9971]